LDRWGLEIRKGDTLLFHTAHYARYYGKPEYMTEYPGLTREGTEYIIDQGCVNFGVDSPSPDMWNDKTYPCHIVCAQRESTHVENLCNLDQLLGRRFTFIGLPLKIREDTGYPIRAVAILNE
jgi:kynurenine formamidase